MESAALALRWQAFPKQNQVRCSQALPKQSGQALASLSNIIRSGADISLALAQRQDLPFAKSSISLAPKPALCQDLH
eukprot:814870-Pelagomonas_calceolata.AAC.6